MCKLPAYYDFNSRPIDGKWISDVDAAFHQHPLKCQFCTTDNALKCFISCSPSLGFIVPHLLCGFLTDSMALSLLILRFIFYYFLFLML